MEMFFMDKVIKRLSQGSFFRSIFSGLLKIVAVITAILGIVGFIYGLTNLGGPDSPIGFFGYVSEIIVLIVMLKITWINVQILWVRGGTINDLQESDFNIIPIMSVLLKTMGETTAVTMAVLAVAGGIFMQGAYLVLRNILFIPLPFFGINGYSFSFAGRAVFMLSGLLYAFTMLILFYFLSEILVAVVDIAQHAKAIRIIAEQSKYTRVDKQE